LWSGREISVSIPHLTLQYLYDDAFQDAALIILHFHLRKIELTIMVDGRFWLAVI
jgi:hypothetical protein